MTVKRICRVLCMMVVLATLVLYFGGCGWGGHSSERNDYIVCVPGTLKPLMERFAIAYENEWKDGRFVLKDVSSRHAWQMVADESVDSAITYYDFNEKKGLLVQKVGEMPYVFFVNESVGVKNLSSEQLGRIFSGQMTNWKEAGGADKEIVILHPNYNTALPDAVRRQFSKGRPFPDFPVYSDESGDLPERVERTGGAIAYQDMIALDRMAGYHYGIEIISIDGSLPYINNIRQGKYKAVLPINVIYRKHTPQNDRIIKFITDKLADCDFFLKTRIK